MKILSQKQIIDLQAKLIERYGEIYGIRDEGLIESAINTPFQTFSGYE